VALWRTPLLVLRQQLPISLVDDAV
jgi:hypothetical protein